MSMNNNRNSLLPKARPLYTVQGTSLIRNCRPLGPYSRPVPRALWWSQGGGRFLMSEVPLSCCKECRKWVHRYEAGHDLGQDHHSTRYCHAGCPLAVARRKFILGYIDILNTRTQPPLSGYSHFRNHTVPGMTKGL